MNADEVKPAGDEELREAVARLVDPEAYEEYFLEDGRVDAEVASIFEDAVVVAREKADAILSLINSRQAGEAEGWKLVPVEPTEAMIDAALALPGPHGSAVAQAIYSEMLRVAPDHGNGEGE